MNKKITLFLFTMLFLFFSKTVLAQNSKPLYVGLMPYTYESRHIQQEFAEQAQMQIFQDISKFNNIILQKADNGILNFKYLLGIDFYKVEVKGFKGDSFKNPNDMGYHLEVVICIKIYDVETASLKTNQIYTFYSPMVFRSTIINGMPNYYTMAENQRESTIRQKVYQAQKDKFAKDITNAVAEQLSYAFPFKVKINNITKTEKRTLTVDVNSIKGTDVNKYTIYEAFTQKQLTINGHYYSKITPLGLITNVTANTDKELVLEFDASKETALTKENFERGVHIFIAPKGAKDFLGIDSSNLKKNKYIVAPFTRKDAMNKVEVKLFEETIKQHLVMEKKVKVLERTNLEQIMKERGKQKYDAIPEAELMAQGKSIGADYMLFGDFRLFDTKTNEPYTNEELNKIVYSTGKIWYHIEYDIQFRNVQIGTGVANESKSEVLTSAAGGEKGFGQAYAIRPYLVKYLDIKWVSDEDTPITAQITNVAERDKKNNPKIITIDAGENKGAFFYEKLTVAEVVEEEIDGKKMSRNIKVATLKRPVIAQDTSNWEVTDGEKKLTEKMTANKKLVVVNYMKK